MIILTVNYKVTDWTAADGDEQMCVLDDHFPLNEAGGWAPTQVEDSCLGGWISVEFKSSLQEEYI